MDIINIIGKTGKGKTTRAITEAIETNHQEILFVTAELCPMEFGMLIERAFQGSSFYLPGDREIVIDEMARFTYHMHGKEDFNEKAKYDVVISDMLGDDRMNYLQNCRETYIVTQQMINYSKVIVLD